MAQSKDVTQVTKACNACGIVPIKIANEDDALNERGLAVEKMDGVFIVDHSLGRGFDLKLGKDSFVLVLDSQGKVNFTEA